MNSMIFPPLNLIVFWVNLGHWLSSDDIKKLLKSLSKHGDAVLLAHGSHTRIISFSQDTMTSCSDVDPSELWDFKQRKCQKSYHRNNWPVVAKRS